jgi:hypothetical protein
MTRPLVLTTASLLLFANLAIAQQEDRPRTRTRQESTVRVEGETNVKTIRRISMVIGANVTLHGDHAVGPVEDIVISEDGCIEYVVVRYKEKFLPVPWTVVTVNFDERVIILDLDEARLAKAPMFSGDDWSVLVEADWSGRVTTFFQADRRQPGRDRDRGDRPGRGTRPRSDDRGDDNPRRPNDDDATPGERPDNDDPATSDDNGEGQPTTAPDDSAPSEEGGKEAPGGEANEGTEQPETPAPPQPREGAGEPQGN